MIRGIAAATLLLASAAVAAPPPPPAPTLEAIDAALAAGQAAAAHDLIDRARIAGDSPDLALRQAEVSLAANDLAAATTQFTQLAALPALAAQASQGLGITLVRLDRNDEAAVALDRALALDPKLTRAWLARGVVADRKRDWAAADAAYTHAMALDPASTAALVNRGYSRLLQGHFVEAEADLARAVALAPGLTIAATDLRLARAMQGKYDAAFAGVKRPDLARDLNMVGFAAMARGDYGVAEAYFNRALKLSDQFDHTAWANLQYLQQLSGGPVDKTPAGH